MARGDDSTLSVNSGRISRRHLRQVIEQIEIPVPWSCSAIGIGHDVTRYYRRALTVTDPEELAGAMTDKLVELFDEDVAWRQFYRAAPGAARAKRRKLNERAAVALFVGKMMRIRAAAVAAALLVVSPALADKPTAVLKGVERLAVSAIPIHFDRDNAGRKAFGKLIWRGGINLDARSPFFGGYSGLIVDPSGRVAAADLQCWNLAQGHIDYDGRSLKGLRDASIGPVLGRGGKPLATDAERELGRYRARRRRHIEVHLRLLEKRNHRIQRYPFTRERFGPPDGALPLPGSDA